MAGYLGTKAVLLSTTAADVVGNAEIGGDLTVGGNVGIGTSSPSNGGVLGGKSLHVSATGETAGVRVENTTATIGGYLVTASGDNSHVLFGTGAKPLIFYTDSAERMRIDSSGNLLVGKTSDDAGASIGVINRANGRVYATVSGGEPAILNRLGSDGDIIDFKKDGTTVGSIGIQSGGFQIDGEAGHTGILFVSNSYQPRYNGSNSDNFVNIGGASNRFDDIYATNGTIQTSDRNEKQDIEALSDAEQRVAVACKGLLRKFRWKDAVAEKGDDARIHFGIIAQDLQDAFTAEGLDAGRYAMFISSTWWETQTNVPAVQAVAEVLDDEGNVVTEAVEAKEAYTRTDRYETLAEAPAGATERTRLGVRYPELLAFIIGAM